MDVHILETDVLKFSYLNFYISEITVNFLSTLVCFIYLIINVLKGYFTHITVI